MLKCLDADQNVEDLFFKMSSIVFFVNFSYALIRLSTDELFCLLFGVCIDYCFVMMLLEFDRKYVLPMFF